MGETACLPHAFPRDSSIPNEANQNAFALRGNPLDALGDSVSFGRFMKESLDWDKWSTFSQNKRHVEEAERYSKPGSVAQKKAFFEAHYKRIAAMKAAALLEENGSSNSTGQEQGGICNNNTLDLQTILLSSQVGIDEQKEIEIQNNTKDNSVDHILGYDSNVKSFDMESHISDETLNQVKNIEDQTMVSSATPQMEKAFVKKPVVSSSKASVCEEVSKNPCSPAKPNPPPYPRKENIVIPTIKISRIESADKNMQSPKSLGTLFKFSPIREPDKLNTPSPQKVENSKVAPSSYKASKDYATPLRTSTAVAKVSIISYLQASMIEMQKHPSANPYSETKRTEMPIIPSASGGKRTRSKWHILFAFFSKSLRACRKKIHASMLPLRTKERAAQRKQARLFCILKLEDEKFKDNEVLELQLETKFKMPNIKPPVLAQQKVETEVRKLRKSLCFERRPLPDFYSEKENSKTKQIPVTKSISRKPESKHNISLKEDT
ncbi:hypothetical protein LguiA_017003 [Lonicera macranthoides]